MEYIKKKNKNKIVNTALVDINWITASKQPQADEEKIRKNATRCRLNENWMTKKHILKENFVKEKKKVKLFRF